MKMVGIYHIALLTTADEDAFVAHVTAENFANVEAVLQLTRVTSGFHHQLLKRGEAVNESDRPAPGLPRRYAWHVTVQLVGDAGYSFEQNLERLQDTLEKFGVVIGVETYAVTASPTEDSE
jgi:hypothetical protein